MSKKSHHQQLVGTGIAPEFRKPTPVQAAVGRIKTRHYVQVTIFILASALFFAYYSAFILEHLTFKHGYLRMRTAPKPNFFRSARYSWMYWVIWLMTCFNYIVFGLLAIAFWNNTIPEWAKAHYWLSRTARWINALWFVLLIIVGLFLCNGSFPNYTFCADPRWCGVHYADTFETSKWCPNNSPFIPPVSPGLAWPEEYWQLVFFSFFFALWAIAHWVVNIEMRKLGFFREVFVEEDVEY